MKNYTALVISSFIVLGVAGNAQALQTQSNSRLTADTNYRMLSAQTEQAPDVRPHRGSGRRDAAPVFVETVSF